MSDIASAENINALWGALLIEELYRLGVAHVWISPGSRSTPLTVAAARHPAMQTSVAYDERGAAFQALGYARATGRPAALICTSGTAVANYYPAVIEASVDHVPLLVLSADRPPELRHTGANQTIQQPNIFGQYPRWHQDLPCPDPALPLTLLLTTVDQAYHRCISTPAGPVHLNCMFREPLAPRPAPLPTDDLASLSSWLTESTPYTTYTTTPPALDATTCDALATRLRDTNKGLVVLGRHAAKNERESQQLQTFLDHLGWPFYADPQSGLRWAQRSPLALAHLDLMLLSEKVRAHIPEVVLHLGGPALSKRLGLFLRDGHVRERLLLHEHAERIDAFHQVTQRIVASPARAASQLTAHLSEQRQGKVQPSPWLQRWQQGHEHTKAQLASLDRDTTLQEPLIARQISQLAPEKSGLFLASSMPIRDMEMYAHTHTPALQVGANRGASGIDGLISSAIGFARGRGPQAPPTTLLIGDLSLLHDINALEFLTRETLPLVIVVLNNRGGGIFSFLPIAEHKEVFETFFGTPHTLTFAPLAAAFGIAHAAPPDIDAFIACYRQALTARQTTLIEVMTDREDNLRWHRAFEQKLQHSLDQHFAQPLTPSRLS